MSVQRADDVTLHDLLIYDTKFSVTARSSSEPLTALKAETYKDSAMEANWEVLPA